MSSILRRRTQPEGLPIEAEQPPKPKLTYERTFPEYHPIFVVLISLCFIAAFYHGSMWYLSTPIVRVSNLTENTYFAVVTCHPKLVDLSSLPNAESVAPASKIEQKQGDLEPVQIEKDEDLDEAENKRRDRRLIFIRQRRPQEILPQATAEFRLLKNDNVSEITCFVAYGLDKSLRRVMNLHDLKEAHKRLLGRVPLDAKNANFRAFPIASPIVSAEITE